MGKIKTPDWVLKGEKKVEKKEKQKTFKIRKCPKCGSDDVSVVLGMEEGKGKSEWECRKCKWAGRDIVIEQMPEEEFMKYLDEKREEIP